MSKPEKKSYLERITFDPKLTLSWVARYVTNIRLVLLLSISIIILGVFSYISLPQRLNPEIKIPIVTVATLLPGAGPNDVESLITIPLEDKLRGLSGLDTISSVSQDNVSIISMQFLNSTPQEKAKADVKDAVESINTLPTDAKKPQIDILDFENQPVWQFAVTTPDDIVSLSTFSQQLKEIIKDIPNVDKVTVRGLEEKEIAVDILPEKIAQYNLSPLQISQLLKSNQASYPAGSVDTEHNAFSLTIDSSIQSVADIRSITISVNGTSVHLGDIATVHERASGNQTASYIASRNLPSRPAVTFSVYKRSQADIIKTAESVKSVVKSEIKSKNDRFKVTSIENTGERITTQFTDLVEEFKSTILLVFLCLFLFLGLRQATISSVTVPLTFLSAFFFMRVFGMTINFLSLFAFLLSLGLLVDDTIVTVSAMTAYFKSGKFTPSETGLLVWRDTIVPIWSTTITTIWSFVPLLLSSGIIGEFIKPIPVVVTVTMISSTAIAVLITLPIMIVLLKPKVTSRVVSLGKIVLLLGAAIMIVLSARDNPFLLLILAIYLLFVLVLRQLRRSLSIYLKSVNSIYPRFQHLLRRISHYANHGVIDIERFSLWYEKFITKILENKSSRRKVAMAIIMYALFSFALLPLGLVHNEFFPKADADLVYTNLELPSGTKLEETKQETERLLDKLRGTPDIEFVVADVGTSISNRFSTPSDTNNTSLFTFHLPPKSKRKHGSIQIAEFLRKNVSDYTKGKLSVVELSGGPPAGADIQLTLSGDDLGQLNSISDKIVDYLSKQPGTYNVQKSIKPGTSALVFVPDPQKLAQAEISTNTLGLWLRIATSGFALDEVHFDQNSADKETILFSFGPQRLSPESLSRIMIPLQKGSVPLNSLGTFEAKVNPSLITREGGKRTLSVSAGVKPGFSIPEKNSELLVFANTIQFPNGFSWKTAGVNEENQKSVQSIIQAMGLAFLLILVTMVIQFQSFRQAIIVLLVIPLAVSSVFLIFAISGTPLSFPALIGVLSLFGIVVTNSMFIVDKINLNLKEGMPYTKAIAEAGASRMEPIILTKLCTVFGLLPITLADPLWRGLGGAIISGLLISSTIMLLFIPVVYYSWMKPVVIKTFTKYTTHT